jgi:hypothetical protein
MMARRLRDNEKAERLGAPIEYLVGYARRHFQSIVCKQSMVPPIALDGGASCQHIEELTRLGMGVPDLERARWHTLLDDAQTVGSDQMPSIATFSPTVVLSAGG